MTPTRFADLAAAWGADIARWPHAERVAARCFLAANPDAQATLDGEAALDRALHAWTVPPAPPFLDAAIAARIRAGADRRDGRDRVSRLRAWLAGSAAAAALAAGLATGIALGVAPAEPDPASGWYHLSILGAPLAVPADAS